MLQNDLRPTSPESLPFSSQGTTSLGWTSSRTAHGGEICPTVTSVNSKTHPFSRLIDGFHQLQPRHSELRLNTRPYPDHSLLILKDHFLLESAFLMGTPRPSLVQTMWHHPPVIHHDTPMLSNFPQGVPKCSNQQQLWAYSTQH